MLAVDVNKDHLAGWVIAADGNPLGQPITVPLELAGLPADTRDGRLRAAISELIHTARTHSCRAFVIENLGFDEARSLGREHTGRRPNRGIRGRAYRRMVSGIPTAKFRDRLTQMACNTGVAVITADPAYTSKWGAQHWLGPLDTQFSSEDHAAAYMIGRRGLGQRARRGRRCDWTRPEDREQRATTPARKGTARRSTPPALRRVGLSKPATREAGDLKAQEQTHQGPETQPARRPPPAVQAHQDRSGAPAEQDSLLLSV